MADEFEIHDYGIEETCAALDALQPSMQKAAIGKALAAGAVPIVSALRSRTPRLTGDLAEHIMTDIALDANGKGGTASIGFGKAGFKARMVEYGHRMVGHKPGKKEIGQVPAQPFMRPTAAASGEAAIEAFSESLAESVDSGLPGMPKTA